MIELKHLRKEYETVTPLEDVNVTINDGDIISVIGPSGTGKSTLLRCINLLEKPTSGQIIVNGTDITAKGCNIREVRKKMGMVFQSFNLFGHRTVLENVMRAPVDLLGVSRQEAYKRAMELLRMVGMERRAMEYPEALSGGQKQRVAIARTLAMDPDIILFDEPTSALDPTMVDEVQSVIRLLAGTGKTMMIVTHELRFAREISSRVFYMDDGGVYEDGTPEQIFDSPRKERTRRFINKLKLTEIVITPEDRSAIRCINELSEFFRKNSVPEKMRFRIEAVFEELCLQMLLPRLNKPMISFAVEYDEAEKKAKIIVRFNGERFDPSRSDDMIALSILRANAKMEECGSTDKSPYTNKIIFTTALT